MTTLRLEVPQFRDLDHWRWRLTDAGGAFLADHEVALDSGAPEYEGFVSLDRHLRWRADAADQLADEAKLVARVGRWVGAVVLGPVGPKILDAGTPVTVRVIVPPEAEVLLYRPLELAYVGDQPLALQDVSLVFEVVGEEARRQKRRIGDRLRMLAVFSLPTDTSALSLRRERHELRKLIRRIAQTQGKAIELRVLQYGVTRHVLESVLSEGRGWDVIHFSGHGLPAGLLLEKLDGTRDPVSSTELVRLLRAGRHQLKLVTLSSCESAAVTAAETLRRLGLAPPTTAEVQDHDAPPLPAAARALMKDLDCGVLAMRYPVGDDFAIALAGHLYEGMLGKGQLLPRALQLALPRAAGGVSRPGVPPASVATPALFGPRTVDMSLVPPEGPAPVFDVTAMPLAYVRRRHPEPERFVGRVGPMARASAALAPQSRYTAVLFHGMPGAGKTACALELLYQHEHGRFQRFVWYEAPSEGHAIDTALAELALAFETQLSLKMIHVVDQRDELQQFLPFLTESLEQHAVLIALDNLECLLTADGDWRDDRWRLVINALVRHHGLSRLILTSRRLPHDVEALVLLEAINALSLGESVLLARELPHLGRLMRGESGVDVTRARKLATRTLKVVQGHPKLIELADGQAADPEALARRLEEGDRAWEAAGGQLDTFFKAGESAARAEDFLHVLEGWTRGIASQLDEGTRTLFFFLCALEEEDRKKFVVANNWSAIWRRLGREGDQPPLDAALSPLIVQGLVAREDTDGPLTRYVLHAAVAESGRAEAQVGFQSVVDAQLGEFWRTGLSVATSQETELGGLVMIAGLSAAPYLIRLNEWALAAAAIEQAISRDPSPTTNAAVLPLLRRLVAETTASTAQLGTKSLLAFALVRSRPGEAEALLDEALAEAVAGPDWRAASIVASDVVSLRLSVGRLPEALTLIDDLKKYTGLARLGPWTQLGDESQRLRVLAALGRAEEVLARVEDLRDTMRTLPEQSDQDETAPPWSVRETILRTGSAAALRLGRPELALTLNEEIADSEKRRGAPELVMAQTHFNDYGPLLALGYLDIAERLLHACRAVFDAEGDLRALGKVFCALADLESNQGRWTEAILHEERALRYKYRLLEAGSCAVSHFNLANHLMRAKRPLHTAAAHRLAAGLIDFQSGDDGSLRATLLTIVHGHQLGRHVSSATLFNTVCDEVERIGGVRFRELFERLPKRAPTGAAALGEVLRLAVRGQ